MNRKILFLLFVVLAVFVISYIEYGIRNYDLRFYAGKDNGLAIRFESICVLSTIYFFIMSERKRIFKGLLGLIIGIATGIICYILLALIGIFGLSYHIISCLTFMLMFYGIDKRTKTNANIV